MNQCKDCAKWEQLDFGDRWYSSYKGDCGRAEGRDNQTRVVVWSDNGACPAFEARKDWADECAAKIDSEIRCGNVRYISDYVRHCAKAHYEAKP